MLLEAAMAELHQASAPASSSPDRMRDTDLVVEDRHRDGDGIPPDEGHEAIIDVHEDVDDGINADCDGISLLHDSQVQFASRVLNRGPSNLCESSRFGSYRSMAVAAGKVPFHWEAQPGKAKNPITIAEEEDELPPLSLPPIHLSPNVSVHRSPSSSATPSPRSLTGKVKSLIINHVKKPSLDHFSFINGTSETSESYIKSPSKRSSHKRRERKLSSLSNGSAHSSISPYHNSIPYRNGNTKVEEYGPRSSLNYSDPSSSPYYFSPLSNSSYLMSHGVLSPRPSVEQSSSSSNSNTSYSQASISSNMSSGGSNSSSSSIASTVMPLPNRLASCLLSITSMANDETRAENIGDSVYSSNDVFSFASPEMEILDEGPLSTGNHSKQGLMTTMEDFIGRGGPQMNRSLSTSRLTFTDDFGRKLSEKSKYYYSSQLSLKGTREHINSLSPNLDELFPLKPPNVLKGSMDTASKYNSTSPMAASIYNRQSPMVSNYTSPSVNGSPDDGQSFVDALDSSFDTSIVSADDGEMKTMIQSIMNPHGVIVERPAQEVVMEAYDENGFAFNSPVASAFVFSPRKGSPQRTTDQQWNLSDSNTLKHLNQHHVGAAINAQTPPLKSILKKPYSQELMKAAGNNSAPRSSNVLQQKSLNHGGSQKISSVLLRFAEAEEQLLNKSRHHHHHHHQGGMRSTACMKPMCYALGRAFLCKSSKISS